MHDRREPRCVGPGSRREGSARNEHEKRGAKRECNWSRGLGPFRLVLKVDLDYLLFVLLRKIAGSIPTHLRLKLVAQRMIKKEKRLKRWEFYLIE